MKTTKQILSDMWDAVPHEQKKLKGYAWHLSSDFTDVPKRFKGRPVYQFKDVFLPDNYACFAPSFIINKGL